METNDFALIQRVLEGDDNAFTVLVNRYQKTIHTFVWRKIGDFHTAEELTQDIFLRAYKKLSLLKPPYHFSGWLHVIAARQCIAWIRKKQEPTTSLDAMPLAKLEELSYTTYEATGAEAAGIERQRDLVKRLLQKLPESERTVVTMHYLAEMPCEKISEFLGVSPNTVKSRLHRARKRLQGQEHLLHDVSGIFQVPPTLTANIMREVARIQPTVPSTSKPWVPWGVSFASTCLILLMIGVGTRALYRFQQPYSLDATSEMTIEFVEAPVVLPLQLKPDVRNQFGNTDTLGKNNGAGQQPGPNLLATLSPKEADAPTAKPQWVQTGGTGEISHPGLFLAADQSLYAVAKAGLYRFTPQMDAWTLVSASGPKQEFNIITEYRDTLYLLTSDELLVSTDEGKTWRVLGARPEGSPVALVITDGTQQHKPGNADMTMYLVLRTEVFRSQDAGKQWEFIGHVLRSDIVREDGDFEFRIWDALAIDNTLFVGTSRGLFRLSGNWKKLPVPTEHGINSLAVAEERLYVGTSGNLRHGPEAQVLYSTDLGDSWTDITPNIYEYSAKTQIAIRVVPVGKKILLMSFDGILCSYDAGETWMDLGNDRHAFGASPTIALDESNFYRTYYGGITRSTDGGDTWHPFVTGIANFNVRNLSSVKNVLCGVTGGRIIKSKNGGESWETLNVESEDEPLIYPKIQTSNTTLYLSSTPGNRTQLFYLPVSSDVLIPVPGVPDFEEDNLYTELMKRRQKARETNVRDREAEQLWDENLFLTEDRTNGNFTLAGKAVFMERRRKLFRWRPDETEWHYTGLEDGGELSPLEKGFALAALDDTIYAGKREGDLFRSLDGGDTWKNITQSLAFPFAYFKDIVFVGSTLYISTDAGVMRSHDGEKWGALTDSEGCTLLVDQIATDGSALYGVCASGVYQVDSRTNTWKQIAPEIPYTVTSLAVDGNTTLCVGTQHNGIFRFQRDN